MILCGAALLVSTGLQARDFQVGVVNPGRVLESIPHTQEARERIEKEFAPRAREIKSQQREMQEIEEKLRRDSAIMAQSERDRLERELLRLKRSLKRDIDELREDRTLRESQELSELQSKIVEVIQTLGKEGKFDLILVDGVIYADDSLNLTEKVISRLSTEFKGSGGRRGRR